VTLKSSDTKIATVSGSTITFIKAGKVSITATPSDNSVDPYKINFIVRAKTTKIALSAEATTIDFDLDDHSIPVGFAVTPSTASKQLKWTSSNENVATVSEAGTVEFLQPGTVTITAAATDGSGIKGTIKLTAGRPIQNLTADEGAVVMLVSGTKQLKPEFLPANTTETGLTWSSDNTKVAKVSASGLVTAVAAGSAKITAQSESNKNLTATW